MRVLLAARHRKTLSLCGQWQSGKMPRTAFPLSKNNSFRLGRGWDWCIHELIDANYSYKLLVAFHKGKAEFLAWLTMSKGTDQAVLARLEYHRSHLGWHVHLKPSVVDNVSLGVVKMSGERLIDCASNDGMISEKGAAEVLAFKMFNVEQQEWGLQ